MDEKWSKWTKNVQVIKFQSCAEEAVTESVQLGHMQCVSPLLSSICLSVPSCSLTLLDRGIRDRVSLR